MVQLRDKHATPRELYNSTVKAVLAARRCGVRLILNDRVDIALAAGADGVHLGQDDLLPDRARRLIGPNRILGFSTHTMEQATAADSMPVDYIAVGPIFATSTKVNPDAVLGLESLAEIRSRISKPLVAIGGITLPRARAVLEAGADSLAIISALYTADDISGTLRALNSEVG